MSKAPKRKKDEINPESRIDRESVFGLYYLLLKIVRFFGGLVIAAVFLFIFYAFASSFAGSGKIMALLFVGFFLLHAFGALKDFSKTLAYLYKNLRLRLGQQSRMERESRIKSGVSGYAFKLEEWIYLIISTIVFIWFVNVSIKLNAPARMQDDWSQHISLVILLAQIWLIAEIILRVCLIIFGMINSEKR